LLAAAPKLKLGQPSEETVPGSEPPNPAAIPSGCSFRTRCKYATDRCAQDTPELRAIEGTHAVACHYWRTDTLEVQT
ncbi:MAG: oligopeptide/dipeptide ABC transporter ATP-binding protein, partial [Candidatus Binatia bacterium]